MIDTLRRTHVRVGVLPLRTRLTAETVPEETWVTRTIETSLAILRIWVIDAAGILMTACQPTRAFIDVDTRCPCTIQLIPKVTITVIPTHEVITGRVRAAVRKTTVTFVDVRTILSIALIASITGTGPIITCGGCDGL